MSKPKSKSPVPPMHPREQLTKKARAAIFQYATHKCKLNGYINYLMIKYVLEAERMPRERLYAILENKWGYVWFSDHGYWYTKKELAE